MTSGALSMGLTSAAAWADQDPDDPFPLPPKDMIERSPEKAKWKNGMPGGPDNPLGARALYLFQNGNDTLYRIHGTTEPMPIGTNASSGCIRMLNQDVIELYRRAPVGSRVVVMAEGT